MRAPKKEKRLEEKTVFLLLGPEGTALRQRPDTGLLAGLWEYPHVPGRLTEEQAARQLRQWGLTPRAWLRQLDARAGGGPGSGGLALGRRGPAAAAGDPLRL